MCSGLGIVWCLGINIVLIIITWQLLSSFVSLYRLLRKVSSSKIKTFLFHLSNSVMRGAKWSGFLKCPVPFGSGFFFLSQAVVQFWPESTHSEIIGALNQKWVFLLRIEKILLCPFGTDNRWLHNTLLGIQTQYTLTGWELDKMKLSLVLKIWWMDKTRRLLIIS